ncbi:MAG: signal peptidase I [Oscillospiraceae bacterium]|jgi:signal peptidase|nr:signal peptidase I [Oscillospiraceae bacterium]
MVQPLENLDIEFFNAFPNTPARSRKSGRIATGLIALLALVAVAAAVCKLAGVQLRAVLTGSMEPDLPVGSLLVIVPVAPEKIGIGDDVAYYLAGAAEKTVVTHRVVGIDTARRMLATKGVANTSTDPPVPYEDVTGVVRLRIPWLGMPALWAVLLHTNAQNESNQAPKKALASHA